MFQRPALRRLRACSSGDLRDVAYNTCYQTTSSSVGESNGVGLECDTRAQRQILVCPTDTNGASFTPRLGSSPPILGCTIVNLTQVSGVHPSVIAVVMSAHTPPFAIARGDSGGFPEDKLSGLLGPNARLGKDGSNCRLRYRG